MEPPRFTELPPDLLKFTLTFLSGFDLLSLSHVSRQFYLGVLVDDGDVWKSLAPSQSPLHIHKLGARPPSQEAPLTAKQQYFAHRAIRFYAGDAMSPRGGAIPIPSSIGLTSGGSFAFDLVFALQSIQSDASPSIRPGGILLGAQSEHASTDQRARYHEQLVYMDPDGNLYCSVMREKPVVAKNLLFDRWYHVALVFDVTGPEAATQRVYLNGELVHSADGWLHDEWKYFTSAQIGTGCITGGVLGAGECGWYAFNGLVDECRIWRGALNHDEVRCLASFNSNLTAPACATCSFSMRNDAWNSALGKVSLVRATSPSERMVRQAKTTRHLCYYRIPVNLPTEPFISSDAIV